MDLPLEKRTPRYGMLSLVIVCILGGGLGYKIIKDHNEVEATMNFTVSYPRPSDGWISLPHGPQTLFLYGNEKKGLLMRGSVNQMISDVNPTPDLDRDNLAKLMIDNTHDNMRGWTADMMDKVDAKDISFRLVRRSENHHVVLTAFAVKGNTTALISLSARNKNADQVDKSTSDFEKFLATVGFVKADTSKW